MARAMNIFFDLAIINYYKKRGSAPFMISLIS